MQGRNDPFNEFYGGSHAVRRSTAVDKTQLDALGFHVAAQNIVVTRTTSQARSREAQPSALLSGPPTITDTASTTLSSATIKIANTGGSAVTGDLLYINGQQSGTVDGGLVTVSWNASTGTLKLIGTASIAVYRHCS